MDRISFIVTDSVYRWQCFSSFVDVFESGFEQRKVRCGIMLFYNHVVVSVVRRYFLSALRHTCYGSRLCSNLFYMDDIVADICKVFSSDKVIRLSERYFSFYGSSIGWGCYWLLVFFLYSWNFIPVTCEVGLFFWYLCVGYASIRCYSL